MPEFSDQLIEQIRRLEDDEMRLLSQLSELRGRLRGLRDALQLFQGEPVHALSAKRGERSASGSRVPDPSRSRGWAAALQFLDSAHPSSRTVEQIEEATARAGHPISRNTLRSVLSHAVKEKIVERVSVGRYRLTKNEEPSPASAEDGSNFSTEDAGSSEDAPSQGTPDGSTPSFSTPPLFRTGMR